VRAIVNSFFIILLFSCQCQKDNRSETPLSADTNWISRPYISLDPLPDQNLTELIPCDILVKPNLNWLPGTTQAPRGYGFGHAAIVIRGAKDTSEATLLTKVLTFESQARDVPGEYQVRQVAAYLPGEDYAYANYNFKPANLGRYYRLRMDLTDQQRDAIIAYLIEHDSGFSNTRAWKDYHSGKNYIELKESVQPLEYWYCSLIIWQAFYDVLGIDLDANQGLYVYPNDLINSPYFNTEKDGNEKRIRF
jgi:hypothetical protein